MSNTIILVGMPRGQHKVLIELVDAEGNVLILSCSKTDPGQPCVTISGSAFL